MKGGGTVNQSAFQSCFLSRMSLFWFSKSGKMPKKRSFLPLGLSNPDIIIDQTDIHLPNLVGTVLHERQESEAV